MNIPVLKVKRFIRDLWRGRWIAVAVAWAVALVFIFGVMVKKDRYEATARIYIDTQSVLKPLMVGLAFQPDIDQQIRMLAKTLISRPNMEKIRSADDMGWDNSKPKNFERDIEQLYNTIKVAPGGGGNIYLISYRDTDAKRAERLVDRLVKLFVNSGGSDKRKDSEDARKFIDEEIKLYESKLVAAENALKEFKLKNLDVAGAVSVTVPGTGGGVGSHQDYFARMSTLSDEVSKLQLELGAAEKSRDALKRELSSEDPQLPPEAMGGNSGAPIVPEIDARLEAQRKLLDDLLRRYTEEHPDVASTRRAIAQLERQKRQEAEARAQDGGKSRGVAATNPVFQKIRFALAESEANVASLRTRLSVQQDRLAQVKAQATRAPQIEAELSQLNRDYDVIRKNYEQLVTRRESAAMGEKIDQSSPLAEFRIIDPPRASPAAVFPNRMMLAMIGGVVSIAAGLLAAFAWSLWRPVVDSTAMLREISGRPVLGSVSLLLNNVSQRQSRIKLAGVFGAIGLLVVTQAAWVGWIAIHSRI